MADNRKVKLLTPDAKARLAEVKATTDARLSATPPTPAPRVLQTAPQPAVATPSPQATAAKPLALSRLVQSIKNNPKKAIGGAVVATALEVPSVVSAFQRGGTTEGLKQIGRSTLNVAGGVGGAAVGSLVPGAEVATVPAGFIGGRAVGEQAGNFIFGGAPQDGATQSGPSGLAAAVRSLSSLGRKVPLNAPEQNLFGTSIPAPVIAPAATANDATGPTGLGGARPVPARGAVATRAQAPLDVLGTFTGSNEKTQTITRARADELAAKLPTLPSSAGLAFVSPSNANESSFSTASGSGATARLSNGNTAQFQAQRPSTSRIDSATRQIDATIAGLGELNMRSERALVGQLLDAKARLASGQFNTEAGIGTNDASIAQRQASDILSADTSSTNARLGRARTVVGADGALRAFDPANPASLTPVTDAAGNPIFTPQKTAADPQAKFQNDALLKLLGNQLPGQGLNEKQIQEQLDAITRLSSGGGAGLQQVGTGIDPKTGKVVPIFRDANGNVGTK